MAARAPRSAMGPGTGAALEASCPVSVSLEASRAPTPPPRWMVYGAGHTVREGGVTVRPVSPCPVFPSLLCPYMVFPVPRSHVLLFSFLPAVCSLVD